MFPHHMPRRSPIRSPHRSRDHLLVYIAQLFASSFSRSPHHVPHHSSSRDKCTGNLLFCFYSLRKPILEFSTSRELSFRSGDEAAEFPSLFEYGFFLSHFTSLSTEKKKNHFCLIGRKNIQLLALLTILPASIPCLAS